MCREELKIIFRPSEEGHVEKGRLSPTPEGGIIRGESGRGEKEGMCREKNALYRWGEACTSLSVGFGV